MNLKNLILSCFLVIALVNTGAAQDILTIKDYTTSTATPTTTELDFNKSPLDQVLDAIGSVEIGDVTLDTVNVAAGGIDTFDASVRTLSATTGTAVSIGDLGDARIVYVTSDKDVNFGGASVTTGEAGPFIPGGAPYLTFTFTTATPSMYFIGRTEDATVTIQEVE
jgi:hypothetical protein